MCVFDPFPTRKPDKTEEEEPEEPCPYCGNSLSQTKLDCPECKNTIPYCIITVSNNNNNKDEGDHDDEDDDGYVDSG